MHEGIRPKVNPPKIHDTIPTAEVPAGNRPTRRPFGTMQLKLAHEIRKGFHGHWFNDIPGRISRALEAGYEHVKDKEGKNVSRVVGTAEGGGALIAFLMEIPEEWYQEDMKQEQSQIDAKEEMMRTGKLDSPEKGYVGAQGITIQKGN